MIFFGIGPVITLVRVGIVEADHILFRLGSSFYYNRGFFVGNIVVLVILLWYA